MISGILYDRFVFMDLRGLYYFLKVWIMLLMDVGKFSNVYILWFFYRFNGKFILNIVRKMILRSMLFRKCIIVLVLWIKIV